MAQLTRLQARTLIRQLIDDTAAQLWADANLDLMTEAVVDELWGELLDWDAYLRSTAISATIVSPGYFDLDGLTRFYRLQSVVRNGQTYRQANAKEMLIDGTNLDGPDSSYVILGSKVWLFPLDATTAVNVTYADRPTAYTSLASDVTAVTWPDGYHMAYVYETAARAMEKGDREKSDTFRNRAGEEIARLRAYLRKRSVGPVLPWYNDDARSWGGV